LLASSNVILHVVGPVLAAFGMSPGTPLVPLPQGLEYLPAAPLSTTPNWADTVARVPQVHGPQAAVRCASTVASQATQSA
jgi:hypothetical protein